MQLRFLSPVISRRSIVTSRWSPVIILVCSTAVASIAGITDTSRASAQMFVAHRGASFDAPENTLAAFQLAWQQGADAVEGDFYLSKDGQIVCIHDKTTKRTAGVELVVADATLDELKRLDVGRWKSEEFVGQRIPTLLEVLATVPQGKKIFIEIKCGPEIVEPLKTQLSQCSLSSEQLVIICFNRDVVTAAKQQLPNIKCQWLVSYDRDKDDGQWRPSLESVLDTAEKIQADGIDTNANLDVVDERFVEQLRDAELQFHCWTVNDPQVGVRMCTLGVDSITTDRPLWLREQLESSRESAAASP
ncbi:MAG: glycerophosphodiester phosphodiesterase [Planctomycetales bacterium]|nr:glycerophosphodiester phosphodiesterase [Planctomycetales bacterium]